MTSSHHGPYTQGNTRTTMARTKGSETVRWSESQKTRPSPDCSLQLDCMKSESLVILDQHARVNAFPGLVHTARHTTKVGFTPKPVSQPRKGRHPFTVGPMIGVKSEQGSRRGTCGWITSLYRIETSLCCSLSMSDR